MPEIRLLDGPKHEHVLVTPPPLLDTYFTLRRDPAIHEPLWWTEPIDDDVTIAVYKKDVYERMYAYGVPVYDDKGRPLYAHNKEASDAE